MPVFAPEARIELLRGREPRELVRIGTRGLVVGPAGGPLVWKVFTEPRRADEAWYFLQTYAPFQSAAPAGELAFRGRGRVKASRAERRMVFEWSRRVAVEATGGRAGPAYGLLLSWHQVGVGGCEDLAFYLAGEAVASACGWEGEIQGRLEPGQLERTFAWFDDVQPFQAAGGEDSRQPGLQQTRLVFAGHGPRPPTASQQREIQAFAASLFAELAARRVESVPAPDVGSGPEAVTSPAAPPRQRYLLPPEALRPRPQEVVLQLPERPPPPPRPAPRLFPRIEQPAPEPNPPTP